MEFPDFDEYQSLAVSPHLFIHYFIIWWFFGFGSFSITLAFPDIRLSHLSMSTEYGNTT